ncbi:hypothetical protein E1262_27250 [Jiangella aurantiaca]|uniref:SprT-like domain-containing protein n=1 Tax=Jiangella aurantiaca TaxID=2530373 RepID=A0A4V2YR44_9ACTN|nr:hypothetical protein [Jiangella aurantiaca]TDD64787.1 hypothetical protein E1262_27250 [Jiangella aurantiaca]
MNTTAIIARTETGSQLVAALETVWRAIQARHPEVPDVVMITGSGKGMLGLTWGHFGHEFWANGRFRVNSDGVIERDRKHELFVSGETLGVGAVKTVQTLLHEATHAVAAVRGVKDTSRQHRYHNKRFLAIAEELGLEYRAERPDASLGFSSVEITDETRQSYADVVEQLDAAIVLTMELPEWARLLIGGGQGGTDGPGVHGGDGTRGRRPGSPGRKQGRWIKATCGCGRIVRAARTTFDAAPITCGGCGETFTVVDV